ncbi:uncharacterized protein LOC127878271 [Dreissena polymorpha]|uniref:uncharacterized protein LOC127878271 n=1 Tax=Dreissena polymorpha TaxID=45954 RepID=UPI0022643C74|nr:uncharacterized protein LOC127878271 [Dreissena polymorpha]
MPEVGDKTARWYLSLIVLTPVILLGLVGNCLSMLTWSRGSNRNKSTAVLLTCLAVTDTIVLAIPALEMWADEVFNFKLRLPHVVLCKLFAWASYFGPTMSSWIIVLVTLERFVSIWFPVRNRHVSERTRAANSFTMRAIALSIILLVCLLPVTSKEVYHSQTGTNHEGLLQVVVSVLLYANSALNFLLYCAIGTGFRTDMKKKVSQTSWTPAGDSKTVCNGAKHFNRRHPKSARQSARPSGHLNETPRQSETVPESL